MSAPRANDPINDVYASVAHRLRDNGYAPVPLSGKSVRIKGWPATFCDRLPSHDEIARTWSARRLGRFEMNGVGVATADGLVIIDVDDDGAVARVLEILPQARSAPACRGRRGRKIFLRSADGKNESSRNLAAPSTDGELEVLSYHRQGVIPPTYHPGTGAQYTWIDEDVTLLSVPPQKLPALSVNDFERLRSAFVKGDRPGPGQKRRKPSAENSTPSMSEDPVAQLRPGWWAGSKNREKIEELIRLFGIVHRAAREGGGRIVLQVEGHRPEIIDIDSTEHWKHVVRIIVDVLGNTDEAYLLHIEVSQGNAALGLPGGPSTYNEVGNRKFFATVVAADEFALKSGKPPRTRRSLYWWVRMITGRAASIPRDRGKGLVKPWYQALARVRAAGVAENVVAARARAAAIFRDGSKKLAVVNSVLDGIASNYGWMVLPPIEHFAASLGASTRTVQEALAEAHRTAVLVRTRGNEGGKAILVTVHATVGLPEPFNVDGLPAPSLQGRCAAEGGHGMPADATNETSLDDDTPPDEDFDYWFGAGPQLPDGPYGDVRTPGSPEEQEAFDEFVEDARRGRSTEEALLLAGILPVEAAGWLLHIVEQNRVGRNAGSKWPRMIAGEIGELIVREPQWWPQHVQGALDYVAKRVANTKGRGTPCKCARIFAENLGYVHHGAGRLTPMARVAEAQRRRLERKQEAEASGAEDPGSAGG